MSEEIKVEQENGAPKAPDNGGRRLSPRTEALVWWSLRLLPFAILVAIAMIPVSIHVTSTNDFCKSCHLMVPYYESWAKSSHQKVECLKCHLEPGIAGTVKGKIQALSQLTRYVTRTYGTRPWAEVADGNCTQCHSLDTLKPKELKKGNYRFMHGPHINGAVREKKLKCTTCHTQTDTNSHISVNKQACYLCHFKPDHNGQLPKMAACTTCHGVPDKEISYQDSKVHHKDLVARGVSCNHCHAGVYEGTGPVAKARCQVCHADPKALEDMEDPKKIHEAHVSGKGVQCMRCHTEITHQRKPVNVVRSKNECNSCHGSMHSDPAALYSGVLDGKNLPSPMFKSGIECRACHEANQGGRPDEAACFRCHGPRIRKFMKGWKDDLEAGRQVLQANVRSIWDTIPTTASEESRQSVKEAVREANYVASVLENGRGIHNIQLSRKLLLDANAALRKAAESAAPTASVTGLEMEVWTEPAAQECIRCHFGMEKGKVPWQGYEFSHKVHALDNNAACTDCHQSKNGKHGALTITLQSCKDCHDPIPSGPQQ